MHEKTTAKSWILNQHWEKAISISVNWGKNGLNTGSVGNVFTKQLDLEILSPTPDNWATNSNSPPSCQISSSLVYKEYKYS